MAAQTFQNTHLDSALLSHWEHFPKPSQGEHHLVEIEIQLREPNFAKWKKKIQEMEKDAGQAGEDMATGKAVRKK